MQDDASRLCEDLPTNVVDQRLNLSGVAGVGCLSVRRPASRSLRETASQGRKALV